MKRLINLISLIILLVAPLTALAVTQKEMDQARALATRAYLRYANDGSGYLDDLNPKSMADLEKSLKQKEKENIVAFKKFPVPSDYASWDKQKLVEYWGVKAFEAKGLIEKGRQGRNRARKHINAMAVSAPAAAEAKKADTKAEPAKEAKADEATKPGQKPADAAKSDAAKSDAAKSDAANADAAKSDAAGATGEVSLDAAKAALEGESGAGIEEADPEVKRVSSNSWIYIVILCILVAVVVALVVFASNVMKKNSAAGGNSVAADDALPPLGPETVSDGVAESDRMNAMRDKFAATLTTKNNEISALARKVETLNAENASLKNSLEAANAEVASLRNRLAAAERNAASASAGQQQNVAAPRPAATPLRTIYLGRANAKGIFVRADRNLNVGNSIYRLDTTDGYAGSFRVANDPTVWEMALLTPRESLSGACVAPDLEGTAGMTRIVNDSAGTAIFEGGCWKVIRKAKIHYE